jgi:hypothetical protein
MSLSAIRPATVAQGKERRAARIHSGEVINCLIYVDILVCFRFSCPPRHACRGTGIAPCLQPPTELGKGDSRKDGQTAAFKTRTPGEGFFAADHQRRSHARGLVAGPLSQRGFHASRHRHLRHRDHRGFGEPVQREEGDAAFWLGPMRRSPVDGMAACSTSIGPGSVGRRACHKSATCGAYRAGVAFPRTHFPLELGRVKKFRGHFSFGARVC